MDTASASALVRVTVTVWVGGVASRTEYVFAASVAWPSVSTSGPASATLAVEGSASTTTAGVSSSSTATERLPMAKEAG